MAMSAARCQGNVREFQSVCRVVTLGRQCQYRLYARENRNVFSLDLNVPSELLSVTVLGEEFQVAGAAQRKARLAKALVINVYIVYISTHCELRALSV